MKSYSQFAEETRKDFTDCNTDQGVLEDLLESLIAISRVLVQHDLSECEDALADLADCEEFVKVVKMANAAKKKIEG